MFGVLLAGGSSDVLINASAAGEIMPWWIQQIPNYLTALAAVLSAGIALIAVRSSIRTHRASMLPILQPKIEDLKDPKKFVLVISNVGTGTARNIRYVIADEAEKSLDTDMLPASQGGLAIKIEIFPFRNSKTNILFDKPKLVIKYEDVFNEKFTTTAFFKKDRTAERAEKGHVDQFFESYFFSGLGRREKR